MITATDKQEGDFGEHKDLADVLHNLPECFGARDDADPACGQCLLKRKCLSYQRTFFLDMAASSIQIFAYQNGAEAMVAPILREVMTSTVGVPVDNGVFSKNFPLSKEELGVEELVKFGIKDAAKIKDQITNQLQPAPNADIFKAPTAPVSPVTLPKQSLPAFVDLSNPSRARLKAGYTQDDIKRWYTEVVSSTDSTKKYKIVYKWFTSTQNPRFELFCGCPAGIYSHSKKRCRHLISLNATIKLPYELYPV